MDFLKQATKALMLLLAADLGVAVLYFLGLDISRAQFMAINGLVGFGAIFFFLYDYMDFIGVLHSLTAPGLDLRNPPARLVWKFLGSLCFIVAFICLIAC